jgi:SAM-dependent methyltransferase
MTGAAFEAIGGTPAAVLDVGCGVGTFLNICRSGGVTSVTGLEGDWLDPKDLVIDQGSLRLHDLREPLPDVGQFDFAISLEVAEHLPSSRAASFIEDLCMRAPAIMFSAAIPLQGGVGHLNERWPSWWAKLFAAHRFVPVDCIRPLIWSDNDIATWYRQNTVLYMRHDHPAIGSVRIVEDCGALDLVHPLMYLDKVPGNDIPRATKSLTRATRRTIRTAIRRAIGQGDSIPPPAAPPDSDVP